MKSRARSIKSPMELPTVDAKSGLVNVVVEAPRGSPYKYKFDPASGQFLLHKGLPAGAVFPFDFGFVPRTKAADGDPLDVMILLEEPAIVGAVVPVRLIGVIEAEQVEESGEKARNDRLLAVLETAYNPPRFHSISEIDEHRLAEIEHFFISYNEMEGRTFRPIGRGDADKAIELLRKSSGKQGRTKTHRRIAKLKKKASRS